MLKWFCCYGFHILLIAALCAGCGDKKKGACVVMGGSNCLDNKTSASCHTMWPNASWHKDVKCSELGFKVHSAYGLILSELYYGYADGSASLHWIEVYNGGPDAVALESLSVVYGSSRDDANSIHLNGAISPGQAIVFTVSQTGDVDSSPHPPPDAQFVALFGKGESFREHQPISAVVMGELDSEELFGFMRSEDVFETSVVVSSGSLERTGWSRNEWRFSDVPGPNAVAAGLSVSHCDSGSMIVSPN